MRNETRCVLRYEAAGLQGEGEGGNLRIKGGSPWLYCHGAGVGIDGLWDVACFERVVALLLAQLNP